MRRFGISAACVALLGADADATLVFDGRASDIKPAAEDLGDG